MVSNVVAIFVATVVVVVINRAYAREGDTADAGRLAAVMALVHAVFLVTAAGLARSVTLRISRARAQGDADATGRIGRTIGAGLALTAVVSAALVLLGQVLPTLAAAACRAWRPAWADTVAAYGGTLRLAALWWPGLCFVTVSSAVFDGFQRMRWSLLADAGLLQALRLGAAIVVMVVLARPWTTMVAAWALSYNLSAVLVIGELGVFLKRRAIRIGWRDLPLRGLSRDAVLMFLPAVAPMLTAHAGVLVAWLGGGSEGSAAFWVTWSLAMAMSALAAPVGRVLLPAVPALDRFADRRQLARVLRLALWGASGLTILLFVVLTAAKGWVLEFLHQGDQRLVLTAFMAAGFFEVYRMVLNPVLLAGGAERAIALLEWAGLAVILVAGTAAMASLGLGGLAGVFLVVYVGNAAGRVALVRAATAVALWRDALVLGGAVLVLAGAATALEHGRL